VNRASAAAGSLISELPFPEATRVVLVVRGNRLLAPTGNTALEAGDHVYVFSESRDDEGLLHLVFGAEEDA
jgi:NhaP-type Na+/H+ and K+/H+ antiporter